MRLGLEVIKDGKSYDMSNLVADAKIGGRRGTAARTLTVSMLDDDGYGHSRSEIDVEQGQSCIFTWDGKEEFQGMFMRQTQTQKKNMALIAYDNGIRLAKNRDTFVYKGKTGRHIFKDCCTRFQIPYGAIAETGYIVPDIAKSKTTAFDVITDALSQTYKATGKRYYPVCVGNELQLIKRSENILQWVIETGGNLEGYTYVKSIEDIKTRIKLVSSKDAVLAQVTDPALEAKLGIFQEVSQPKDDVNSAQLYEIAKNMLDESSQPERVLSVTARGISGVITGVGVYVIISPLGISKTYYVEEDTHVYEGDSHQMQLKLIAATDLEKEEESAEIKVGDIVQFLGGSHYYTSMDDMPVGGNRTAGLAKCTRIVNSAIHPYHLIGGAYNTVSGNCNVYGWVDADKVKKGDG